MSNNPKATIALAFFLTFVIGFGAGYLFCGVYQNQEELAAIYPADDPSEPVASFPAPRVAGSPDERIAPQTDMQMGEINADPDIFGQTTDAVVPSARPNRPLEESVATLTDDEEVSEEPVAALTEDDAVAEDSGVAEDAAVTEEASEDEERTRQHRSYLEDRSEERTEERMEEQRQRRSERMGRDTAVAVPNDRDERQRTWRPDSDEQRMPFSRFRLRLVRELKISEEEAEVFFSILEEHRRQVREQVIEPQRELQRKHRQLAEELDEELSDVLSDEQMEVWREKFAPQVDRSGRSRTDRSTRQEDGDRNGESNDGNSRGSG
ncbi:MAG: hypothetical protein R6U28_05755 [Cyclonatronaceae bacterium]